MSTGGGASLELLEGLQHYTQPLIEHVSHRQTAPRIGGIDRCILTDPSTIATFSFSAVFDYSRLYSYYLVQYFTTVIHVTVQTKYLMNSVFAPRESHVPNTGGHYVSLVDEDNSSSHEGGSCDCSRDSSNFW